MHVLIQHKIGLCCYLSHLQKNLSLLALFDFGIVLHLLEQKSELDEVCTSEDDAENETVRFMMGGWGSKMLAFLKHILN